MVKPKPKQYRDAVTGQFVPKGYADNNPNTTVSITPKPKSSKRHKGN
jgi:hypothetical protein